MAKISIDVEITEEGLVLRVSDGLLYPACTGSEEARRADEREAVLTIMQAIRASHGELIDKYGNCLLLEGAAIRAYQEATELKRQEAYNAKEAAEAAEMEAEMEAEEAEEPEEPEDADLELEADEDNVVPAGPAMVNRLVS